MATNEIQTRIALKHDSYANWDAVKDSFKPLAGELCIVEIPSGNTAATTVPTILFKVGAFKKDAAGKDTTELHTFAELPWASAKAADVYGWAKQTEEDFKTWLQTNHAGKERHYSFELTNNDLVVKYQDYINGAATGELQTLTTLAIVTDAQLAETLANYYTKDDLASILVEKKDVQKAVKDPTANGSALAFIDSISQDEQGVITATKKNVNLDDYAKKTDLHAPTTVTQGEGIVVSGDDRNYTISHKPTGAGAGSASGLVTKVTTDEFGHVTEKESAEWRFHAATTSDENQSTYNENEGEIYLNIGDNTQSVKFYGHDGITVQSFSSDSNLGIVHIHAEGLKQDIADDIAGAVEEANGYTDAEVKKEADRAKGIEGGLRTDVDAVIARVQAFLDNTGAATDAIDTLQELLTYIETHDDVEISGILADLQKILTVLEGFGGENEPAKVKPYVDAITEALNAFKTYVQHNVVHDVNIGEDCIDEPDKIVAGALAYSVDSFAIRPEEPGNKSMYLSVALKKGGVTTEAIADGAVTTEKIASNAVTEAKLSGDVQTKLNREWQPAGNYKTKQTAVTDKITSAAHVIESLTQNENGEIAYTVKELTPADIGAQEAGDYATRDEVVEQDIAILAEAQKYTDNKNAELADSLHTIATSGSIYDVKEGSNTSTGKDDAGVKYIIFNCGSSTTVI